MGSRPPLTGYNHNIRYAERVYHVQTEDSGADSPHIDTHVFLSGMIISSARTDYKHLLETAGYEEQVRKLMQDQHKRLMKELRRGDYNQKIVAMVGSLEPAADQKGTASPGAEPEAAPSAAATPPGEAAELPAGGLAPEAAPVPAAAEVAGAAAAAEVALPAAEAPAPAAIGAAPVPAAAEVAGIVAAEVAQPAAVEAAPAPVSAAAELAPPAAVEVAPASIESAAVPAAAEIAPAAAALAPAAGQARSSTGEETALRATPSELDALEALAMPEPELPADESGIEPALETPASPPPDAMLDAIETALETPASPPPVGILDGAGTAAGPALMPDVTIEAPALVFEDLAPVPAAPAPPPTAPEAQLSPDATIEAPAVTVAGPPPHGAPRRGARPIAPASAREAHRASPAAAKPAPSVPRRSEETLTRIPVQPPATPGQAPAPVLPAHPPAPPPGLAAEARGRRSPTSPPGRSGMTPAARPKTVPPLSTPQVQAKRPVVEVRIAERPASSPPSATIPLAARGGSAPAEADLHDPALRSTLRLGQGEPGARYPSPSEGQPPVAAYPASPSAVQPRRPTPAQAQPSAPGARDSSPGLIVDLPYSDDAAGDEPSSASPTFYSQVRKPGLPEEAEADDIDAPQQTRFGPLPGQRTQPRTSRVFGKPLPTAPPLIPADENTPVGAISRRPSGVYLVPGFVPERPPHPDPHVRTPARAGRPPPPYGSSPQRYTAPSRLANAPVTPRRKNQPTGAYEQPGPVRPTGAPAQPQVPRPAAGQPLRPAATAMPRGPVRPGVRPGAPAGLKPVPVVGHTPPTDAAGGPPRPSTGAPRPGTGPAIRTVPRSPADAAVVVRPAVIINQPADETPSPPRQGPTPRAPAAPPLASRAPTPMSSRAVPADPASFGAGLISERSLDEVILSYLAEDVEPRDE